MKRYCLFMHQNSREEIRFLPLQELHDMKEKVLDDKCERKTHVRTSELTEDRLEGYPSYISKKKTNAPLMWKLTTTLIMEVRTCTKLVQSLYKSSR